jgi:hypothetical protein
VDQLADASAGLLAFQLTGISPRGDGCPELVEHRQEGPIDSGFASDRRRIRHALTTIRYQVSCFRSSREPGTPRERL